MITDWSELLRAEVAVTFPMNKIIETVNINSGRLSKAESLRTEPECWGICYNGFLVYSTESGKIFHDVSKRGLKSPRWRSYSYKFRDVKSLEDNDDMVYVCEWGPKDGRGSLTVIDQDEKVVFSYSNSNLQRPVSCAIDCENNVYICDAES